MFLIKIKEKRSVNFLEETGVAGFFNCNLQLFLVSVLAAIDKLATVDHVW